MSFVGAATTGIAMLAGGAAGMEKAPGDHGAKSWSLRSPIVTAARDTPSRRATSALVIPPSTIAAHRAHRSGPVSRRGAAGAASRWLSRGYLALSTQVPPADQPGEAFPSTNQVL